MKKISVRQLLKSFLIGSIIGIVFLAVALLFGGISTLVGYINAFTVSSVLTFSIGWFLLISNIGTLDILIYGVKAFSKALVGKRMKSSYYDYSITKEKIPNEVIFGFWLASFVHIAVLIILYILY